MERNWLRNQRVQLGGSILMSLAAFACGPKDTQIRIVQATDTPQPPVAAGKISLEGTLTPTASPTLAPAEIPVIHDSKSDTPTPTATPTATPEPTRTATGRTQGSDTPVIIPPVVPTAERTPQPTATPRPTATPEAQKPVEPGLNLERASQLFLRVNVERRKLGLQPYVVDLRLQAAAEKYAQFVYEVYKLLPPTGYIDQVHTLDGDARDRARREGYFMYRGGEVAAYGNFYDTNLVVGVWLGSSTHGPLVRGSFEDAGYGCYGDPGGRFVCVADYGSR